MPKILKRIGIILGSLVGLILLAIGILYIVSTVRLNAAFAVTPETISVPSDSGSLARGKHLVSAIAKCIDCHGEDLGGKVVFDEFPIGTVIAPNITSGKGGIGGELTDADWVRAIRYGVNREGKGLKIMPSNEYWHNSDAELGEIIAYAKSVPPVDRELEESSVGPLGHVLHATGQLPLLPIESIDLTAKRAAAPPAGATPEYGKHLVTIGGCVGCHGANLSGGPMPGGPPGWPEAGNLTPHPKGLGAYSEADFFRALREGLTKDGRQMNSLHMPWKATSLMKDDEIRAVWVYLQTLPAREKGK